VQTRPRGAHSAARLLHPCLLLEEKVLDRSEADEVE
jgi:hypothetical protein